jgi:hypothetical protein
VKHDIDDALAGWEYKPGLVQARMIPALDGRTVLQMRIDLGILQMEVNGRPDGVKPHGQPTCLAWLPGLARRAAVAGQEFVLTEEQCDEADREFLQFYNRRITWMALRNHSRALADAEHTLDFMDFVRRHAPSEEYVQAHEQYRGFVLFHRTQAAANLTAERGDAEGAIDALREGLEQIRQYFAETDVESVMDQDRMIRDLGQMEETLRERHGIQETLREQLERAVANEDYENAARLRDALKRRG